MKLVLQETREKCPEFKRTIPFIGVQNDVIVHLRWNALHKRGGNQFGDVDWSIIIKALPLEYSRSVTPAPKCSQCGVLLTILILETVLNTTPRHRPQSLINLTGSLYGEAPSDEMSKSKSPWQQRRLCWRMT